MTLLEHKSFVSVIANLVAGVAGEITQIPCQVKIRFSQLISGILRIFQKILKYFKGLVISTALILPLCGLVVFFFRSFWLIIIMVC